MKKPGVSKHIYETVQLGGTEVYVTSELTVEEYGFSESIVTIQIGFMRTTDTGKTETFPLVSYKETVYGFEKDAEELFRAAKSSVVWALKDVGERIGSQKQSSYVSNEVREMFINTREHFSDMNAEKRDIFYQWYMNKQGDGQEKEVSTTVSKSDDECEQAFHKRDGASKSDDADDDYVKRLDRLPEPIRSSMKIVYRNSLKIDAMMNQILEKFSNTSTSSVWGTESLDHSRPEDVQKLAGITEQIKQKWSEELLQKLKEVREIDEEAGNAEAEAIMNGAMQHIEEDNWLLRCAELVKIVQQYDAQGDYVVRSDVSYYKHIAQLLTQPLKLGLAEPLPAFERRMYIVETMRKLDIDMLKFHAEFNEK